MTILTYDDARQIYQETIVEHEGQLHVVTGVAPVNGGRECSLILVNLSTGSTTEVDANPESVHSPASYRLGYVQLRVDTPATYLTRSPRRQYALGWSEHNVTGLPSLETIRRNSKAFLDCLSGTFPSYAEAMERVKERRHPVAFDKQWAIRQCGQYVFYRGSIAIELNNGGAITAHDSRFNSLIPIFEQLRAA